jgi:hypothetical protein
VIIETLMAKEVAFKMITMHIDSLENHVKERVAKE